MFIKNSLWSIGPQKREQGKVRSKKTGLQAHTVNNKLAAGDFCNPDFSLMYQVNRF